MTASAPAAEGAAAPADAIRLKQGAAHDLAGHRISVMAVFPTEPDENGHRLTLALVVLDPDGQESPARLRVDDTLTLGQERFTVARLEAPANNNGGFGFLVPTN